MQLKLTTEEKKLMQILRLIKKISSKFSENYYSYDISHKSSREYINVYLPTKAYTSFDKADDALKYLRKLSKMNVIEYKYDIEKLRKKLTEARERKKQILQKVTELESFYNEAISKLDQS